MRLRRLTQSPADLLAEPKAPDEMRYAELGRYIDALKRSGNDANKLIVEQALSWPCRPPASSSRCSARRSRYRRPAPGAAVGVAISLGTTVIFLLITQIMKAVGAGGVIDPTAGRLAAEHGVSGGGAGAAPSEDVGRERGRRADAHPGTQGAGTGRSNVSPAHPSVLHPYISRHDHTAP